MSPEQLPSKIGKSVGEKLRAARIAQHYTQSQLAAPDFSVSYISAIERGQIHPSLRALEILASRLGLSSTQLLPTRSQQDSRSSTPLNIAERDDDEVELVLLEAQLIIQQGGAEQAANQLSKLSTKRLKRQQQLQHRYLLGWAYFATERFQECEYTLSDALQIAKDLNANYLTLRILNISALAHAAMRNYTQALLYHQRCINLLETVEPHDPFFTVQVYMHMGQHYTQLENLDQEKERQYLEDVLHQDGVARDPLALASIYTRQAEWHYKQQAFEEAVKYAGQAYELAQSLGDTIIGAEALIVLGRVEYALSQYKQGDEHFTAGLEMLERLGSHEELSNESVLYAQLLEEQGKEHEAFTHFRRAFQSRQRLG